MVQLIFISCTDTIPFLLVSEVSLDEEKLIIERQPAVFSAVNDSVVVSIINDKNLAFYNNYTGRLIKKIDSNSFDLIELHSNIIAKKQSRFNDDSCRYIGWDEIDDFNNASLPNFLFYQISFNKKPYVLASIFTPYQKQDTTTFVYSEFTYLIVSLTESMEIEYSVVENYTPHHLMNFKEPFLWPFQGFIVDDSTLYTNINIEGNTELYGNKLCSKFDITHEGIEFKNYINIPLPEELRETKSNILSAGISTPYSVSNEEFYVSNGNNIFNLKTEKQISNITFSNPGKDYILSFGFSKDEQILYYSYYNSSNESVEAVIFDNKKQLILAQKTFSKLAKIDFYEDKLVCLNYLEENEEYILSTYSLIGN